MRRFLRRARVFLSVYYHQMVEFRAELILWMLAGLFPFILMGLWMEAGSAGDLSMTPLGFARYFTAVFIVRQATVVWVIWEFEREVVEGKLSPRLLQPIDPVWHHFATHVSERLARLPYAVALMALFFSLQPQVLWWPGWSALGLALLLTSMAFVLRFTIQYTLAMFCFWTERASAIQELWFLFYLFMSGLIAPLSEYPEPIRSLAYWTPFPYLVYIPSRVLAGEGPGDVSLVQGFVALLIWLAIALTLNRFLWTRGLKRYSAMGA